MAFIKALIFAGLVGVTVAQSLVQPEDPAKYSFQYHVDDPTTGDQKEQQEERDGDSVRGFYTLVEADGTLRRVDYTADEVHGFQAVVTKQAGAAHPIQVARTVVSQPAVHVVSQPIVHHAPVATVHHAPIVHAAPVATTHYVQSAPLAATHYVQSAPLATSQILHAAPVSSQIIQRGPVVSTIPQYVTRTVAPSQYVISK